MYAAKQKQALGIQEESSEDKQITEGLPSGSTETEAETPLSNLNADKIPTTEPMIQVPVNPMTMPLTMPQMPVNPLPPVLDKMEPSMPLLSAAVAEELKPVKAPPLPPSLAKALLKGQGGQKAGRGSKKDKKEKDKPSSEKEEKEQILPIMHSSGGGIVQQLIGPSVTQAPGQALPVTSSGGANTSPSPSSKKGSRSSGGHSQGQGQDSSPLAQMAQMPMSAMQQGIPLDISRVPNPSLFQGNPAMR